MTKILKIIDNSFYFSANIKGVPQILYNLGTSSKKITGVSKKDTYSNPHV